MIKVLIVDDEYIMRQGLKYMINWEQEGFEIVGEATNGAEALQCIEALAPQIIICDIVMPQLDGVDFSEAVHRMYPRIQTIILSGYDKYEYVRHTLINGVVDYILKPTLNPEELRKALQKAVDRIPGARMGSTSGEMHYEHLLERYLLVMHVLGGKVEKAPVREYGKTEVSVNQDSPLFQNVSPQHAIYKALSFRGSL